MAKNKAEEKDEDIEEDLIPVGDGADEDDNESETPAKSKKKQASKEEAEVEEEETEEEASEERSFGHDENEEGEDRDQLRKDRKQERIGRRARQRESRDRDRRELTFLRQRNESLERRFSGVEARVSQNETASINQRLSTVKSQIAAADEVLAAAISGQNGEDAAEALKLRDQLIRQQTLLENAVQSRQASSKKTTETPLERREVPEVPAEHKTLATRFVEKHPWLDYQNPDEDTRIFAAIDHKLLKEGKLSPSTPAYWKELEKRAKRALPDRFSEDEDEDEDEDDEPEEKPSKKISKKNGGPVFRVGGQNRPLRKGEVYISPERRKALEEAGAWDDPVLRRKFLKNYETYDREAASSRSKNH